MMRSRRHWRFARSNPTRFYPVCSVRAELINVLLVETAGAYPEKSRVVEPPKPPRGGVRANTGEEEPEKVRGAREAQPGECAHERLIARTEDGPHTGPSAIASNAASHDSGSFTARPQRSQSTKMGRAPQT